MKAPHIGLLLFVVASGGLSSGAQCSLSGEVFAVDPVAQTVLVRDDVGYVKLFEVDGQTVFTFSTEQPRLTPGIQGINSGDLICVQLRATGQQLADRVIDVPRVDLQRKERGWLVTWSSSVVRGKIQEVRTRPDRLLVNAGESVVEVAVLPSTLIRMYPPGAKDLEEGREGSFSDLNPGMAVSVRLATEAHTGAIPARSVYTGGVTSVAGLITGINALEETVSIRELGTGRQFDVPVPASRVYRALAPSVTAPEPNAPAHALANHHKLANIGFADLQTGDWVLVTGMPASDPAKMTGFAMITRFGYFDSQMEGDLESALRF